MLKVLAALRTVFLIFICGFTLRAMPYFVSPARTFDESYARCADSLAQVIRAAWLAIAWIALETVIGWVWATRKAKAPGGTLQPPSK